MDKSKKYIKLISLLIVFLGIISILISYIFTFEFIEIYIDDDQHIGAHVAPRIYLFNQQMFYLGIFVFLIGIIFFLKKNSISKFVKKQKNFSPKIILLFVTFVLIIIIGELVARFVFGNALDKEFGESPGREKFMKSISYNSDGFRDYEFLVEKNNPRIIVLGDSFTFGVGIENFSDTFPKKSEAKFAANNISVEVYNLGIQGYSTFDQLETLRSKGMKYDPDLVVVGFFLNDFEGEESREEFKHLFYGHITYPYEIGAFLRAKSYLFYFFESRIFKILDAYNLRKTYVDYLNSLYKDKKQLEDHKKSFNEIVDLTEQRNASVVVLIFPVITDFSNYPLSNLHNQVKSIAKERNVCVIDFLEVFKDQDPKSLLVSSFDSHMNEKAHEIVGEELTNFLIKMSFPKNKKISCH
ncbi:MAG: SGNH/GDSL hydrolase family protein [Candidatus Woesearchaeota archaeon]